ncbi:MAG: type IV pilin N-terminal domain-containing protein [Methanosarcinaceae archaeon]|nr:type IV pilin N-terminal domain-containing protein [Methanosarcinaceae archaeon]
MLKNGFFFKNNSAVSEIVAQLLMTTMVVIALSGVGAIVFSYSGPEEIPHPDVHEGASVFSDTIYMRHCGGVPIDIGELEIKLNVNGFQYVCSPDSLFQNLGKSRWEFGDELRIDTRAEWGLDLKKNDSIRVYLIDIPSKQLIYKFEFSAFGSPEWITPQGSVLDTSGGSAKLSDVEGENDGKATVYYPPAISDSSIYEEFVFDIDTGAYGLRAGDSISNVTLKLVYQGHDNNYESIKLSYWDENSGSMKEHEEDLPEFNAYNYTIVDLSSYINTAGELENLKIRFYAVQHAAAEKEINIDYMAVKIS